MEQTRPLRVLFYVQHLLGIGHLMRARRIAVALQSDAFEVTLVTGGLPVPGFEHSGVDQVALAPIAIRDGDFGSLLDSDGEVICLLYTSPSPRDKRQSRMPSSA